MHTAFPVCLAAFCLPARGLFLQYAEFCGIALEVLGKFV
jgi:hypothetical protein